MKVYRFDTSNGTYLGEDFVDQNELGNDSGVTVIPPPEHVCGMIPCFVASSSTWRLVPIKSMPVLKVDDNVNP